MAPKVIRESRSRMCDRGGSLRPKQRESGVMAVDWLKIKTEYINDANATYRSLAEKHRVSQRSIAAHAVEENWVQQRKQQESDTALKIQQKAAEKISDNESEIAAIKSRLRLRIYEQLEQRMNAEEIDGNDFRRLVQSYKDMCDIRDDGDEGKTDGVTVIIDV